MSVLGSAMSEILAVAEQALVDAGLDVPARVYVAWGPPELSCCDTLTVHWDRSDPTENFPAPISRSMKCSYRTAATFVVTVARDCYPIAGGVSGSAPDPADVEVASLIRADDQWVLWTALLRAAIQGDLVSGARCTVASGGPGLPVAPSGGCAGSTIRVLVELLAEPTPIS